MEWTAIVTGLALIEYMVFSLQVGIARGRFDIEAPAITGHEIFERRFRVQMNTLEQLAVFLPALWMFSFLASARIGAAVGVVFLVGRAVYGLSYVQDPKKRSTGFVMGFLANVVLVLGSIGAALASLF
jgi:glutathione S-transferase